jgi:hypothetical protein
MQHRKKRAQLAEEARQSGVTNEDWQELTRQPAADNAESEQVGPTQEGYILTGENVHMEKEGDSETDSVVK